MTFNVANPFTHVMSGIATPRKINVIDIDNDNETPLDWLGISNAALVIVRI